MNITQAKELLPAINHFVNGGWLWYYMPKDKKWYKQDSVDVEFTKDWICNVIGDKHLQARKAYALGEEVEWLTKPNRGSTYTEDWVNAPFPDWDNDTKYRPKSKKVYEWQYILEDDDKYKMSRGYYAESEAIADWIKFEPSKRLRK